MMSVTCGGWTTPRILKISAITEQGRDTRFFVVLNAGNIMGADISGMPARGATIGGKRLGSIPTTSLGTTNIRNGLRTLEGEEIMDYEDFYTIRDLRHMTDEHGISPEQVINVETMETSGDEYYRVWYRR